MARATTSFPVPDSPVTMMVAREPDRRPSSLRSRRIDGEAATSPRWQGIHAFILAELEAAQAHAPKAPRQRNGAELDALLRDAVTAVA